MTTPMDRQRMEPDEIRFKFGENWQDYASRIDEGNIGDAVDRLGKLLRGIDIRGKSFFDIGSAIISSGRKRPPGKGCPGGRHSLPGRSSGYSRIRN